jgi:predicted component of type VI protein secretion system
MKLVIEDGSGTRSTVPFAADEITVGRAAEGLTFRLGERNVSRRHARFVQAGGTVWVEDLGSQTGTRVNGERISGKRKLRAGDLVQIGDYDVAVLPDDGAEAPGAPPPLPVTPRPSAAPPGVTAPGAALPGSGQRPPRDEMAGAQLALPVAPPAIGPVPRRPIVQRTVIAAVLALALGVGAGWMVGRLLSPAPPAAGAAQR